MYEEKRSINWKGLILRILILALIVFLVIWVIQLITSRHKDKDNQVFNQNITTMKEAAENYYKSNALPETIGQKDKMTLEEMIDNNLLMEFTDKNGSFCDEKQSYSQITKTNEDKYQLKVLLSCDDNTDYLVKNMTIKDGETVVEEDEETTTKKETTNKENKKETSKKDESSTTKDNKKDESKSNTEEDEKSVEEINAETNDVSEVDEKISNNTSRTYYTYETKKVYSYTTQYEFRKQIADSTTNYSCPEGYALMGQKCYKSIVESEIDADKEYYEDEELVVDPLEKIADSKKEYTDVIKTTTDVIYSCPEGYKTEGTKANTKCYKVESTKKDVTDANKSCPKGYNLNGNSCVKYDNDLVKKITATKKCPTGYQIDTKNNICVKYNNATKVNATKYTTYTYKAATKKVTYTYSNASKSYNCKNGIISGTKCTYCPTGYNRSGNSCYKSVPKTTTSYGAWYVYTTKKSTTPLNTYSYSTEKMIYTGATSKKTCSKCYTRRTYYHYTVYKRNMNKKTTYTNKYANLVYQNAKVSYKCSNGTLSGTKCKIAHTTYTCATGTKVGTKCRIPVTNYKCNKGDKVGTSCYYCATGAKVGTGSTMKCKTAAKTTNTCSKGTLDGNSCYYCASGKTIGKGANTKCQVETKINTNCKAGDLNNGKCYSCPIGYIENKTTGKCEKNVYIDNTKKGGDTTYSCPEGYMTEGTGVNTKCYKLIDGEKSYYCEDKSFTLGADNKCHKTVKGEFKKYNCPEGYALKDTKCYKTTDDEIDATKHETEAKFDYTWSNNQILDGWEFTGNTRTITNESEETIASPHTGLFDSDNLAKSIIVLSFLTMGVAFIIYLAVRTVKNRRQNIIIK